jgi:hypothetical protein
MSSATASVPAILPTLIRRIAAAIPTRARATFTELLIGAMASTGGHVTDTILAVGLSRAWTTSYWFLERGRWSWLRIWQARLEVLIPLFTPPVWHVVIDDTVVERVSTRAPGSTITIPPSRTGHGSCAVRAGCAWQRGSNATGRLARCR